jgi:hypothetical protein
MAPTGQFIVKFCIGDFYENLLGERKRKKKNSNLLKIRQKYWVPYILLLAATEFVMKALLCNTQYSYIVENSVTVTMVM